MIDFELKWDYMYFSVDVYAYGGFIETITYQNINQAFERINEIISSILEEESEM